MKCGQPHGRTLLKRPSGMGKGRRAAEELHPHPTSQTSRQRTFRSTSDRPAKGERKHPRVLFLGDISKRVSASKVNAKFSLKELLNASEKARPAHW